LIDEDPLNKTMNKSQSQDHSKNSNDLFSENKHTTTLPIKGW